MTPVDSNTVLGYLRRTFCAAACAGVGDEELLGQFVAQRDEGAFAALLRRHGPMVWGVCQRLLVHRQDAEDAFQATFLVLACKAAAIGRRKLLANWLFGVARRAALNVRAARRRRGHREQSWGDPPDMAASLETPWADVRGELDEQLARLPDKYRLPLLLCGLEGMTHAEAGKYLGWPTGTVAGRLSRGRELLRARLLRRGFTVPVAALIAALAPDAASAAVPPELIASVRKAVTLVSASTSAAAVVSPTAATLARAVLMKMFLSRLLVGTFVMAALALALGSAGAIWYLTPPESLRYLAARLARMESPSIGTTTPASPTPLPGNRNNQSKPAIRLPADPNAVVFRMERSLDTLPGPGMALTIYADGRVVAELPDGLLSLAPTDLTTHVERTVVTGQPDQDATLRTTKVLQGRLTTSELEELLRFALHDQEFFDFDATAVKAGIRDQYQSNENVSDPADDATTCYQIQTADWTHEVNWHRLPKAAWDFPKVERLLQLYAVDLRLQQLFYVLLAGGPERVEAVLAKANELALPFYRLYPDLPPLTAADLLQVIPSADGLWEQFTFSRNKDKQVRNPLFEVSIDVPQQGEPTLRYVVPPQSNTLRLRGQTP